MDPQSSVSWDPNSLFWLAQKWLTLFAKEFLDQKLSEPEDDEKFNYCWWDSNDQAVLTNSTATYEEYK